MTLSRYLALLSAIFLSGCANFMSIYRTLDIGDYSRNSPRAVAVDVKQRAIFSSKRYVMDPDQQWMTQNVICPEASPDALSATSLGGAISNMLDIVTPSGQKLGTEQMQLAIATGEAAASIGLRTQSIQLMRDGLVFNCLMFMNGAATPAEAYALQRRSQNITLGLLAIEQLTGAVKADQAALTAIASAGAGNTNVDKEAAAIEAAKTRLNNAKTELEKGKSELKRLEKDAEPQQTSYLEASKNHQDAVTVDQKKSDDTTKAEVKRTRELLESARDALTPKINAIEDQRIAVKGLEGMVDIESQQVKIAQDALDQATHRVRAATNATAFLNASGGRSVLINDKIASTVENIVKVVLAESGRGEMCITLSNQLESMLQKKEDTEKIVAALKTLSCLAAVQEKAAATEDPEVKKELKKVLPQLL